MIQKRTVWNLRPWRSNRLSRKSACKLFQALLTLGLSGCKASILIDSGSTHNFMQDSVAYRLGFELQTLPEFKVFMGSKEYLVCKKVCRGVPLKIQEVTLNEDLYVLSMKAANIVLVIQQLATLGSVLMNYNMSTMEFDHRGSHTIFQGNTPS